MSYDLKRDKLTLELSTFLDRDVQDSEFKEVRVSADFYYSSESEECEESEESVVVVLRPGEDWGNTWAEAQALSIRAEHPEGTLFLDFWGGDCIGADWFPINLEA